MWVLSLSKCCNLTVFSQIYFRIVHEAGVRQLLQIQRQVKVQGQSPLQNEGMDCEKHPNQPLVSACEFCCDMFCSQCKFKTVERCPASEPINKCIWILVIMILFPFSLNIVMNTIFI